jgi:hypothetical protein
MDQEASNTEAAIGPRRPALRAALFLLVVLFMANLNALVDLFFHPAIAYFDEEHVIVGIVTAVTTAVLLGGLLLYTQRLENAVREIRSLKGMLPICSHCKKIRGSDNAWYPVEVYMSKKTDVTFSHGICPECYVAIYGNRPSRGGEK